MNKPRISVIVPVYNVEKYLRQCLDSIVGQTLDDIEIVVLNDGSTDGSLAIINEYAAKDERIQVIDKPNEGYGKTMNRGIEAATGEYIGIVESDDWIEPNMYETLYSIAKSHNVDVVKSRFITFDDTTGKEDVIWMSEHDTERVINPRQSPAIFYVQPSIWSAIYKREFLNDKEIRFLESPGASYQDLGFNFKVWAMAERAYITMTPLVHYRVGHSGQSVKSNGKVFCVCDEYSEIERFMASYPVLFESLEKIVNRNKWNNYKWNLDRLEGENKETFHKQMRRELKPALERNAIYLDDMSEKSKLQLWETIVSKPKISVIVPIYNVEKYLRHCLDSIVGQTFDNIEIILVDDVGNDGSMAIAYEFAEKDDRIKIIHHEKNSGLSAARNTGLRNSSAPFVMFCDSDDAYEPAMCEKMLHGIESSSADIAACGSNIFYEPGTEWLKKSDEYYYSIRFSGLCEINDNIIRNTHCSAWNKIYRRDILDSNNIRFPDGLLYEDAYFANAYFSVAKNIFFINERLHMYLRRPGSIMNDTFSKKSGMSIDHLKIAILFNDFLKRKRLLDKKRNYMESFFIDCLNFAVWHEHDTE